MFGINGGKVSEIKSQQICFKEPNGNLTGKKNWKKNNNQKKSSKKGLNSRMEEEIFNGLKDRKTETTQSEKLRAWGEKMGGLNLTAPRDYNKRSNIHIIGIPEKRGQRGAEKILEEIIAKNFSMWQDKNLQ